MLPTLENCFWKMHEIFCGRHTKNFEFCDTYRKILSFLFYSVDYLYLLTFKMLHKRMAWDNRQGDLCLYIDRQWLKDGNSHKIRTNFVDRKDQGFLSIERWCDKTHRKSGSCCVQTFLGNNCTVQTKKTLESSRQITSSGDYFMISRRFALLFKWASSGKCFLTT